MTDSAKARLDTLKKVGKILKIVSLVLSLLVVVMIVMYLLSPAANLYLAGSDSKYGRVGGYNYYGWQLAIYGCGYPPVPILAMFDSGMLAGDYVPTAQDFATNMTMIYALVIPLLALIICSIVGGRLKNRGKAVCEVIEGGTFIYSAIVLVQCVALSITTATNSGTTPFKTNYLLPAVSAGTYTTCFYPVFFCVLMILFALVKIGRAGFLIYQRNYAKKARNEAEAAVKVESDPNAGTNN